MSKTPDVNEFVSLFTSHARRVYSYIRVLVPQSADADEVFQETSKVLWEKFDEFRPGSDFRAWAFSIAHYKVLQYRRTLSRGPATFDDSLLEDLNIEALAESESTSERMAAMIACYQKLNAADQELVDARYAPGATTRDIAKSSGRSVDAIYRSLRRIHQWLFHCITREREEGGDD